MKRFINSFLKVFVMFVALGGYAWLCQKYPIPSLIVGLIGVFAYAWYFAYLLEDTKEN